MQIDRANATYESRLAFNGDSTLMRFFTIAIFAAPLLAACAENAKTPLTPTAPQTVESRREVTPAARATAENKVRQAVTLMDDGKIDEALRLLDEAHAIDPGDVSVIYEMAYARQLQKEPAKAIALLEPVVDSAGATDRFFQLLGNLYDETGAQAKAIATYQRGLARFPKSGRLYHEQGVIAAGRGELAKAASIFVQGMEVAPRYPTNYFGAVSVFAQSTERGRTVVYAEHFLNLAGASPAASEARRLMWDAYSRAVRWHDKGLTIAFTEAPVAIPQNGSNAPFKPPFATVFEVRFAAALGAAAGAHQGTKPLSFAELHAVRVAMAKSWRESSPAEYPFPLLEWHAQMIDAGVFDTYDAWLFDRPEAAMAEHCREKPEACAAFRKWVKAHPLPIAENGAAVPFDR